MKGPRRPISYRLGAGVIAIGGAKIIEVDGSVDTTGDGANAVFAYGRGSSVSLRKVAISSSGQRAHGLVAAGDGSIVAQDLTVTTSGPSSPAVATDRGGGTITVLGGTYKTSGANAPGIYSTGSIKVAGATFDAKSAEAVVVEGPNSVTATDCSLTGTVDGGVVLYRNFSSRDRGREPGVFTESGGSLTAFAGPLFYVTNTTATINLDDVMLTAMSGVLLEAGCGVWGTHGSNGANVTINARDQTLFGSVEVDDLSTAVLSLKDSSTLTGTINGSASAEKVTLSLDSTSRWVVTGTSYLSVLNDFSGISGVEIDNITGDGHTVYYDPAQNPSLAGRAYSLSGGGELVPA